MLQLHAFVSGRVQGVNFRNNVQRKARQLGLKGYVCNLDNGDVEILAQGQREQLDNLIAFIKDSPGFSLVVNLNVSWEKPTGELKEFRIIY